MDPKKINPADGQGKESETEMEQEWTNGHSGVGLHLPLLASDSGHTTSISHVANTVDYTLNIHETSHC